MISHGPTKIGSEQISETKACDVFRSINEKNANKEMNKNLHGNTFTSSTSKYGNDDPITCFQTKDSERVPPSLEAETPPHLPSQPVPPSPADSNCDTVVDSSEPPLTADQHYPPNVTNSSSSSSDDDFYQSSMSKACIGHSSQLFDSAYYLRPLSTEACQVIKDAEIAPGLYRKRLELHNPGHSDEVANLDATGGAVDSTEQKATVRPVREKRHFPSNENKTGYIIFTADLQTFSGRFWYILPSKVAEADRISKNARSCVFTMYHSRQEYAVKKTIYRSREISMHSQLCHSNIISLEAVLIGKKHEDDKCYAYHFMLKMDMSFRDVLSTRVDGCLKCIKTELRVEQWALVLVNVQYILRSVLEVLGYIHSQKLAYYKIKASNILIKRRCQCQDLLFCTCRQQQKAVIKLGKSSSLDVTSDETVSNTAGDIWSFGCFLLETFLNKCEPLDIVVEEHIIELLKEVQICYADNPWLCDLMHRCLQVNVLSRPTVKELLIMHFFTKPVYEPSLYMLSPYTYL